MGEGFVTGQRLTRLGIAATFPHSNDNLVASLNREVAGLMMGYRRIAHRCIWAVLVVLLGTSAPVAAAEFDRGRALYENHCQLCHKDWAHTREGRVVDSIEGLRARVVSWSLHSGLEWRAEEVDEVTEYLNRRFYQLTR